MAQSLPNSIQHGLRVRAEKRVGPILRKAENPYRVMLGAAIKRARLRCEWSLKEFAGQLPLADGRDRDERQVARWESGDERAPWEDLFALDIYRAELVLALAELSDLDVEFTIRGRRGTK